MQVPVVLNPLPTGVPKKEQDGWPLNYVLFPHDKQKWPATAQVFAVLNDQTHRQYRSLSESNGLSLKAMKALKMLL